MKYLIDTDIIVYHLRQKKFIPDAVLISEPAVSLITYGELLYGAYKSQQQEKALRAIDSFFEGKLPYILPINEPVIELFARTKGTGGQTIGKAIADVTKQVTATHKALQDLVHSIAKSSPEKK